MGQDSCDETEPAPPPVSAYCHGNDYSIWNNVSFGYEVGGVAGGLAAILHGDPSDKIRSTVQVTFGSSYCSGVVIGPKTVLTAGHCGYGENTAHTVKTYKRDPVTERVVVDQSFAVAKHIVHPRYLDYIYSGNTDYEGRKSDLMILHTVDPLPEEVRTLGGPYDDNWAESCNGLTAQGFGRWTGDYLDLRETKYIITSVYDKLLVSRRVDLPPGEHSGRICFGDSGGPLYADVGGVSYLAGITTTTMSSDCEVGGSHVRVSTHMDWILDNMEGT
jgi:hypothetical protein